MRDLPKGWCLSTLDECFFDIRNGTTIKQNKDKSGVPVSRIETIQNGRFDLSRTGYIESISQEQIELLKYNLGDIAFSHINSYEHVGKTALYCGEPKVFIHGMNLLRLRLGHNHVYPKSYWWGKVWRALI